MCVLYQEKCSTSAGPSCGEMFAYSIKHDFDTRLSQQSVSVHSIDKQELCAELLNTSVSMGAFTLT